MSKSEQVTSAGRAGLPWATILTVCLAIAKWGFGVPIAAVWVFAPFWLPILVGLTILAFVALLAGVAFGIYLLVQLFTERNRGRPPMNDRYFRAAQAA